MGKTVTRIAPTDDGQGGHPPGGISTPPPQREVPGHVAREARMTFMPAEGSTDDPVEEFRRIAAKYDLQAMSSEAAAAALSELLNAFWRIVQDRSLRIDRPTFDEAERNARAEIAQGRVGTATQNIAEKLLELLENRILTFEESTDAFHRAGLIDLPTFLQQWLATVGQTAFPDTTEDQLKRGLVLRAADIERHKAFAEFREQQKLGGHFVLIPPLPRDQVIHRTSPMLHFPGNPSLTPADLRAMCMNTRALHLPDALAREHTPPHGMPLEAVLLDQAGLTDDAVQELWKRVAAAPQPAPHTQLVQFALDQQGDVPRKFQGKSVFEGFDEKGRFAPVDATVIAVLWRLIETLNARKTPGQGRTVAFQNSIPITSAITPEGSALAFFFGQRIGTRADGHPAIQLPPGAVGMWALKVDKKLLQVHAGPLIGVTT